MKRTAQVATRSSGPNAVFTARKLTLPFCLNKTMKTSPGIYSLLSSRSSTIDLSFIKADPELIVI